MVVSKKRVVKRVLSLMMALALVFTMWGGIPQKVLAEDGFRVNVYSDGSLEEGDSVNGSKTLLAHLWYEGPATSFAQIGTSVTCSDNKIYFNGVTTSYYTPTADNVTLVVNGTCEIAILSVGTDPYKLNIQMTKGSKLTIGGIYTGVTYNPSSPEWSTKWNQYITVTGGTVVGGVITAGDDAIDPTSGSGLAINDTATEEGKTEDNSPTYKVTDNKDGSRSVTYEKPAKDAKGTETIKAEVKLTDGNTYKVTEIAPSAFENFGGKDKITEIKVGDNVEKIGKGACKGMKNLKKLTLGDNIEIIDDSAFEGDKALTSLVIGKKVKKIGAKAYADCAKLKKITVKSAKLTKKSSVGKKAFWKINKKAKVKVKLTKKEAKSKAKVIKVFSNKRIGYEKTWKVN